MRLLVTCNPALGHLNPMLPLVRAAQRAGHEVVLATGPDLARALDGRALATWTVGPTFPEMLRASAQAPRAPDSATLDEQVVAGARALFGAAAAARAEELLPRARAWRPELVLGEMGELAGAVVAAALGVPLVVHGYGPLQPGAGPAVAAVAADLAAAFALPSLPGRLLHAPFVDVCPPSLRPPGADVWADLRPLRPSAGEVRPGDALPAAFGRLPHEETVYVTLGTVFNDRDLLAAVVDALAGLEVNLVVTTGARDHAEPLTPRAGHVVVAGHLPHGLLLPRCSAVVSHAGAGTLLGALCHALPQVLLPQMPEQASNAAAAVRRGVALALESSPSPDELRGALSALLSDPRHRAAAQEVAQEIAAMPGPQEVLAGLPRGRRA